jgi:thiamine biosynthesis lipoprotein
MQQAHLRFKAMASPCEIIAAGACDGSELERLMNLAVAEVHRIEQAWSRYRPQSIVSRINAAAGTGAPTELDTETAQLLDFAARLHTLSDGLFDVTSGVLRRAWDFNSGVLPRQADIDALLPLVGWHQVNWAPLAQPDEPRSISLPRAGMQLDFGGFGKEYAADRAAGVLMQAGIAHGLVNLGGDMRVMGPRPDGSAWQMGIQHPRDAQGVIANLPLKQGALATSGDYERHMVIQGKRYAHVLDPRTGWPVSHWQSVSVMAPLCVAAGAMATIALLKQADGLAFLQNQAVPHLLVGPTGLITANDATQDTATPTQ